MKKGGYKIIDLKGLDVTTQGGVTIPGIYDAIEGSYGKPLLLAGINIGGVEKNDIYVIPVLSGDDFTFKGYGKVFTIDDDDKVVTANEPTSTAVSGTSSGDNWSTITIGSTTKNIPIDIQNIQNMENLSGINVTIEQNGSYMWEDFPYNVPTTCLVKENVTHFVLKIVTDYGTTSYCEIKFEKTPGIFACTVGASDPEYIYISGENRGVNAISTGTSCQQSNVSFVGNLLFIKQVPAIL